ncbi:MAG: signal peptide peptidase SppA [Tepidisphaeraceae bacterium]
MRLTPLALAAALLVGCGTPAFLIRPVTTSDELEETIVQAPANATSAKVLVIPIDGMIANMRTGQLPLSPSENMVALFTQQLERAEKDSSIKAVVLRINSPGGTVTGSDTIYTLITRFREKTHKPVIASCQEVCASGGYYIACASDAIVAQPTSLVGSIGVIFHTVSFEGLLTRWGIKPTTVKSGTMKDIGSPFHDPTDAEKVVMQSMIDEYFARFKGIVSDRRHLSNADALAKVTDGRVFSGAMANDLGLVDQVGTLDDAIELARTKANAPARKWSSIVGRTVRAGASMPRTSCPRRRRGRNPSSCRCRNCHSSICRPASTTCGASDRALRQTERRETFRIGFGSSLWA